MNEAADPELPPGAAGRVEIVARADLFFLVNRTDEIVDTAPEGEHPPGRPALAPRGVAVLRRGREAIRRQST